MAALPYKMGTFTSKAAVRVMQLQVNSGTTGVTGLRWNIGFSLHAVPLLSF